MKTVSVIGCGWLGLPLGEALLADGYAVRGSTTRPEKLAQLQAAGIEGRQLKLLPDGIEGDPGPLLGSETLILNTPPGRRREGVPLYAAEVGQLLARLPGSAVQRLLFVSSTSVYGEGRGEVDEETVLSPVRGTGKALVEAEAAVRATGLAVTVLRPGGLVGGDRQPGRFLAGKTGLANGAAPVNLVHRDDLIAVIRAVLAQAVWGETFNVVADRHPSRAEFYPAAARALGLEPPTFAPEPGDGKRIRNERLKARLGFQFRYPDPMGML